MGLLHFSCREGIARPWWNRIGRKLNERGRSVCGLGPTGAETHLSPEGPCPTVQSEAASAARGGHHQEAQ